MPTSNRESHFYVVLTDFAVEDDDANEGNLPTEEADSQPLLLSLLLVVVESASRARESSSGRRGSLFTKSFGVW